MTDRFDSPETLFWLMTAVAALIAALIVFGYIGTDVTPEPAPPLPAHYQHPEGP